MKTKFIHCKHLGGGDLCKRRLQLQPPGHNSQPVNVGRLAVFSSAWRRQFISVTNVGQLGTQLQWTLLLIPEVLDRFKVRALCRTVQYLEPIFTIPNHDGPTQHDSGHCPLESNPVKLLQSKKRMINQNIAVSLRVEFTGSCDQGSRSIRGETTLQHNFTSIKLHILHNTFCQEAFSRQTPNSDPDIRKL